jgi:hypothetical protein
LKRHQPGTVEATAGRRVVTGARPGTSRELACGLPTGPSGRVVSGTFVESLPGPAQSGTRDSWWGVLRTENLPLRPEESLLTGYVSRSLFVAPTGTGSPVLVDIRPGGWCRAGTWTRPACRLLESYPSSHVSGTLPGSQERPGGFVT